jgi:hypothetical protein
LFILIPEKSREKFVSLSLLFNKLHVQEGGNIKWIQR